MIHFDNAIAHFKEGYSILENLGTGGSAVEPVINEWRLGISDFLTGLETLKSLLEDEGLLLSQSRVNIPLNVRGPNIKSGRDHSLIEGNNDLFASLLHLGQVQSPSNTDGIIWPFIGGQKRNQVLSESLYVDKYQASIRTESYCYNWNSPFDQISMKIDADKSEKLIIYKRSNGIDTFNEVKDQNLENSFYKFINEHIKNNIEEKARSFKK